MRWLERYYQRILVLAAHPYAPWYLGGLSLIEAIFFPLPPDVLLIPLVLALPQSAMKFATLTTFSSVLGGLLGYLLGYYAFVHFGQEWLSSLGYTALFQQVVEWFQAFGAWFVIIAGFTPIPYKLITLSAGCLAMDLPLFLLSSIVGRGARFYLVAFLLRFGKTRFETVWLPRISRFSNLIMIMSVFLLVVLWVYRKLIHV